MKLSEVLQRVPGLEKRFVYYLESQGDIAPKRLPKTRIARRDYSAADVKRISRLWDYYRRGYALSSARELVATEASERSLAFLRISQGGWQRALELLKACERVVAAAAVYGDAADLVATVEASRVEEVFQVLHPLFDQGLLAGPPTIYRVRVSDGETKRSSGGDGMLAYVLVKVPAKQIDGVLERLRGLDGITEASAVYGETDIIAKLEVANQDQLDAVIMRGIQDLPEVEATRTFIAVGGMHWKRE